MKVKEVMVENPVTVVPNASIHDAARIMAEKNVGSLLILDKDKLVGIVTEKDFLRRILAEGREIRNLKVSDIMSKPVITVYQESDVLDASEVMKKHNIRRLAVMDDGKLVGIVTTDDLVRTMRRTVEELATTLYIISTRRK